jgi:kynureninase
MEQLGELTWNGIGVWDDGTWPDLLEQYRERIIALVGGSLGHGDAVWFPNVSEALGAVLESVPGGTLVFTAGHFTTGHYVHHQWAENTGGKLVEIPVDPDGSVPTERILAALGPDVHVLSISHALFESGWLQDLPALAAGLRERAPDAMLLLDAYQTAGTVPIDAASLGDHVLVAGGGHKQLRSATGAGFLYVPRRWLPGLTPRRTGWWGHAQPFAFEKGPVRRPDDANRLRSGTPTVTGMAMLLGELATLAVGAGGSLDGGIRRARRVTSDFVGRLIEGARARGLAVRGAWGVERRAAFVVLRVPNGVAIAESMARAGLRVDVRPVPGSTDGYVRVSGNAAAMAYEADALLDAVTEHRDLLAGR